MEMTIDEALKVWLPVIQMGVETMPECKEALDMAIETMRKYQRIQAIMKSKKMDALNIGLLIPKDMSHVLHEIKEVME